MGNVVALPNRSRLEAALSLAKQGIFVFPVHSVNSLKQCTCGQACGRAGKHPWTKNGFKDATDDPKIITGWWIEHPEANIGIACGRSRLVVVDVDPRNDGDNGVVELQRVHGELPPTLTALTGGKGWHYYYRVPDGMERVRSHVPIQGVEIKADGTYIVAPPSSHLLGEYVWDSGQPEEICIAPFWLCEIPKRADSTSGPPVDSVMGKAFIAAGMAGQSLGASKMAVRCPWENEHSCGQSFDSSTVVFGPSGPSKLGWFHCSHASCQARAPSSKELQVLVLEALPVEAVQEAKRGVKGGESAARAVGAAAPWESSIKYAKNGDPMPLAGNLQVCLENMPDWRGCVVYDEARDTCIWAKTPPDIPGMRTPLEGDKLDDYAWVYVGHWFALRRGVTFAKDAVQDVLVSAAKSRPINSLQSHIEAMEWDGCMRIDRWLSAYCSAEDNPYTRFVGQSWLISAIARAFRPGCQADHTLILEGQQGTGKTSVFRVIGGDWYMSFSARNLDDKDAKMSIHSAWIAEIGELAALQHGEMAKIKDFLTQLTDKYRPPYGRHFIERSRRVVFGGSTNEDDYVRDPTGARRFWPVRTGHIDLDALVRDRNLLLAEAHYAYRNGVQWWPDRNARELLGMLSMQQEQRLAPEPWESIIKDRVRLSLERAGSEAPVFTTDEGLTWVGVDPGKRTQADARRVGSIFRRLGYERLHLIEPTSNLRVWRWVKLV
jgi:predicted P-loop ATPase